jgi:hypothetical protein
MACTDGYPTDDIGTLDPEQMTESQLITALNELGQLRHQKWHYKLESNCVLEITIRKGARREQHQINLTGSKITSHTSDRLTELHIIDQSPTKGPVLFFSSTHWTDLIRARSLLSLLAVRCPAKLSVMT